MYGLCLVTWCQSKMAFNAGIIASGPASSAIQYAAWSTTQKTSTATLTLSNTKFHTDATSGSTYANVRADTGITDKRYFSLVARCNASGSVLSAGVTSTALDMTDGNVWIGDSSSVGYWGPSDGIYTGGARTIVSNYPLGGGVDQPIEIAVDGTTREVWIRPNGGAWLGGGDPVTGTTPTTTLGGTGAIYPAATIIVTAGNDSNKCVHIVANPALITGTVPSGFTSGIPV